MVLNVTQSGKFIRISGTIAEVLGEFTDQGISKSTQIAYWSDDGTDAKALIGRLI